METVSELKSKKPKINPAKSPRPAAAPNLSAPTDAEKIDRSILPLARNDFFDEGSLTQGDEFESDFKRLADLTILGVSFAMAHVFRFDNLQFTSAETTVALLYALLFHVSATFTGVYHKPNEHSIHRQYAKIVTATVVSLSSISFLLLLTHTGETFSRVWLSTAIVLSVSLSIGGRLLFSKLRKKGLVRTTRINTVIVGNGPLAHTLIRRISNDPFQNHEIIGYFSDNRNKLVKTTGTSYLGQNRDIEYVLESLRKADRAVDRVYIALQSSDFERKVEIAKNLLNTPYKVLIIPDYSTNIFANCSSSSIYGLPAIDVTHTPLQGGRSKIKETFDVTIAAILIVTLLPFFLLIAIAIKFESKGPIFFAQRRYGFGGREFKVYKFRSMSVTEDGDTITQATRNDKRITKVGVFLRKSSIDELPQLFNVLNGTMSLVGPRPHAVAHNEMYRKLIGGYMRRHAVKPGITGWAQINGCRGETTELAQMEKRVELDREYVQRWSMSFDFYILLKTFFHLFKNEQAY